MNRRHFLVTASAAASQSWAGANDRVRLAIIGVGSRGSAHIREILPVNNVEIAALCRCGRTPHRSRSFHDLAEDRQTPQARNRHAPDLRGQRDRRRHHRDHQSLACPDRYLGDAGRQRRLCRKARVAQHLGRHEARRDGPQVQPDGGRRHAAPLVGPLSESRRTHPCRRDRRRLPGQLLLSRRPRFHRVQGTEGTALPGSTGTSGWARRPCSPITKISSITIGTGSGTSETANWATTASI